MASLILTLRHGVSLQQQGRRKRALLNRALNKLTGAVSGTEKNCSFDLVSSTTDAAYANSALILATSSGTVGGSVNGVAVTVAFATSDTVSAGLEAAAINASTNALVQYLVGATNLKSSLTLGTVLAGTTIDLAGFRFTATAAATGKQGEFSISGNDTADAVALAGSINGHPFASTYLFAIPVAAVCHVYPRSAAWFTGPGAPPNAAVASASTVTVGSATFAAGTHCGIYALQRGKQGNCFTVAASGTGVTVINSETRLVRGLGGDGVVVSDTL